MYAVIESGGKQYRVQPGDIVQLEKLDGTVGNEVQFGQVLLTSQPSGESSEIQLGKPYLSGATVSGEILGQGRGDKIVIVKMRRRKQYRRTQGHRQFYTQVLITSISAGSSSAQLSAEDKKAKLAKFQSHLKPRGEAFSRPAEYASTHTSSAPHAAANPAEAPKKAASKSGAAKKATHATPAAKKKAPAKKKSE